MGKKITLLKFPAFFILLLAVAGQFMSFTTSAPVISLDSKTAVSCHGAADGSINITVTGATSITWSESGSSYSSSSEDIANLAPGSYTVTASNADGETQSLTIDISQPQDLLINNLTATPVSCNGGNDGTITVTSVSGGTAGYQYSRDGTTFQTSNVFNGLTAGAYTIWVKDANGCTDEEEITISQPDVVVVGSISTTDVNCFGESNGSITINSVKGGNGTYQYSLDGTTFQASNVFTGIPAGNYTITVKDSNGCDDTATVTVNQPAVLSVSTPETTPVSCNGGSDGTITVTGVTGGNSGYTYSKDGVSFQASNIFTGLSAGDYTIYVKDSKGCTQTVSATISQPPVLSVPVPTPTPVSCYGKSDGTITVIDVTGGNTGGYFYSIDGTNFTTNHVFSGLTAGKYTITVKDSKGCSIEKSVTITQPNDLEMASPETTPVSCNAGSDGTITAGAVTGGNSGYQYSIDGTNFTASNTFTGLSAGQYTLTVKDSKGCTESINVTVDQPEPIAMTAPTLTMISCNGGNDGIITAGEVTGGNGQYVYSLDNTTYSADPVFDNLSAGAYTLYVKDRKGCILEKVISLSQPAELFMTEATSTAVSCFGGSDGTVTSGTVSGGTTPYLYSVDNITFVSNTTFSGLPAGTHTIFVKDDNGCSLQKTVTVSQPQEMSATVSKTDVSCFDGNDGTISISNATGGSNSFEYSIDNTNWQSSPEFTGLTSGSYPVYIRDAAVPGCIVTLDPAVEIAQPATPVSATLDLERTTVYGTASGTATANPTGGTPGYTYEWRKAGETAILQTTKTATGLFAGLYEVTITDFNGCYIVMPFEIVDALEGFIVSRTLCEGDETTIRTTYFEVENRTALGGVAPYTYDWYFGDTAIDPTRSGIGEHMVHYSTTGNKSVTLTITDASGEKLIVTQSQYIGKCYEPCGKSENIVFDPNNFYIGDTNGVPIDSGDLSNCDNSVEKFVFLKIDKSANTYNPYIELVYVVTGSDGIPHSFPVKGCRDGADIDDDPNDNKENKIGEYIKFTVDPIVFECGNDFAIENFYITWTNVSKRDCGQNNNAFCYSIDDPLVVPTPVKAIATPNEILCKGDSSGVITVTASGGFAPYKYSLTYANPTYQVNNKFLNLPAGDYVVYVKDARGNEATDTVTITEPLASITGTIKSTDPICFGGTGQATVTATGGTPFVDANGSPYYKYLWNDPTGQTTPTAENLKAGSYTVTIIDANGCQIIKTVTITDPVQLPVANAGEDQTFSCGFNTTTLAGNPPETGIGTWTIVTEESPAGGTIAAPNDPYSDFSGAPGVAGTYTLAWTITDSLGNCATVDTVKITFLGNCSTLDFDGVDDHVVYPNTAFPLTSGSFSIGVWVKPHSIDGTRTIFSKRNADNLGEGGFDLVINSGAPTFRWGNSSVSTSSRISTNRWYHIAVVFQNSELKLYVDGIPVGTTSSASNPLAIDVPFIIGAMYSKTTPKAPKNFYHGWIEEVRIWNTALTKEQLHFMMNQRLISNGTMVKGEILPMDVPGNLSWRNLIGYYHLDNSAGGITTGVTGTPSPEGKLVNITTSQERSAPLPYTTVRPGDWRTMTSGATPWKYGVGRWDAPNSTGINGEPINWNIAKISHDLNSGDQNITLLGLISEKERLSIPNAAKADEIFIPGQYLRVTHYLKLNGEIDLIGESQLLQDQGSILAEESTGFIERDQQGTRSSYNYNYWSFPVSTTGGANNSGGTIGGILHDGTNPEDPKTISFNDSYRWADGNRTSPVKISNFWLNTFTNATTGAYSAWKRVGSTGTINTGIGFTMKGTSGWAAITEPQNYTFIGKPNNGTITLNLSKGSDFLVGNPYPSAIDGYKFIRDNIKDSNGNSSTNVFNGTLYFWDHFAGQTHYLQEYIGGYATLNLSGGVVAIATDERINATGDKADENKKPQQFIPVGQAFYVSTKLATELSGLTSVTGGQITFKNSQRVYATDDQTGDESNFKSARKVEVRALTGDQTQSTATNDVQQKNGDQRQKIWIKYSSPEGYYRQILVTRDSTTTTGFDLGYDAPMIENNREDMFWIVDSVKFVIQGVPDFNKERELPLGIRIATEGEFTIEIDELMNIPSDMEIYVKDSLTQERFDLRASPFKTTASPGLISNRYSIVFQKEQVPPTEGEEGDGDGDGDGEGDGDSSDGDGNTDDDGTGDGGETGSGDGDGEDPDPDGGIIDSGNIEVYYLSNSKEIVIENPDLLPIARGILFNVYGQKLELFEDIPTQEIKKIPTQLNTNTVYIFRVELDNGKSESSKFVVE